VNQGSSGNENIGIANELSLLAEKSVYVCGSNDDVVSQGKHLASPASLLEEGYLADSLLCLESAQDLITGQERKLKVAMSR
jgi:hypothetical protein